MVNKLKTSLVVQACVKIADKLSIPISVSKKGDSERGMILLRIINETNKSIFYRSKYDFNNKLSWQIAGKGRFIDVIEAQQFIDNENNIDPDLWIIELEVIGQSIQISDIFSF